MIVKDSEFGQHIDFAWLRPHMRTVYDELYPEFNLMAGNYALSYIADDHPGVCIAAGASFLAYSMIIAAGEEELAASLKDNIFTLGWTEEHCGSDLLSLRTTATPIEDDPAGAVQSGLSCGATVTGKVRLSRSGDGGDRPVNKIDSADGVVRKLGNQQAARGIEREVDRL